MTADRAFVDTNVLVHASHQDEPPRCATARELLETFPPGELVISTQVLVEP